MQTFECLPINFPAHRILGVGDNYLLKIVGILSWGPLQIQPPQWQCLQIDLMDTDLPVSFLQEDSCI